MTRKQKPKKKLKSNQVPADSRPNEDESVWKARTVLRPTVQAAVTLRDYGKGYGDLDLKGLITSLSEQTNACIDGNLGRAEAMLTGQAHTLDAIFNKLAQRAINAEYMANLDTYLKLALRAQSQSRATWEALVAVKNPPIAGYVGQANIAHGPQQVNNAAPDASRARENQKPKSKQLEKNDGKRLDTGKTGTACRTDSELEAVGKIDRAENSSG